MRAAWRWNVRHSALLLVLLLAAAATARSAIAQFPADSGVLNVRDFGAKGDGTHDDTAALTAAIAAAGADTGAFFWRTRIVVLPAGTYRVSAPLVKRYANGRFGSGMILIGESPSDTTIRLADHAPGFGNAAAPRGVIMTTAKLLDGTPTSGGKDYTNKGEGNDAYENFVENLTIDVGAGNPGAIGIDYLANNIGAIRDVRVTAPPGSGAIGISMQRKWPGPALLQRVHVQGFDTGIAVANTEYGVTLDHVRLGGQRRIGLANDGNAVAAADLTIDASATAIANRAPGGLITLTKAVLRRSGEGATALSNRGTVVAHGVALEGFAPPDGAGAPLAGVWQGEQWQAEHAQADLTLEDAPSRGGPDLALGECHPLRQTVRPTRRHNRGVAHRAGNGCRDDLSAVWPLHHRRWYRDPADTAPLRRHECIDHGPSGAAAQLRARHRHVPHRPAGPPLVIERLAFDMTDLGDQLAVEVTARRDVTLRDIVTAGTSLLDRGADGGRVFIEDVCCGKLRTAGRSPVYARQLDTEGGDIRIVNDGSPLTILGLKTEGDCTVLDNRNGARSVILGGLLYIVRDADPQVPAFSNANGSLLATFVEEFSAPTASMPSTCASRDARCARRNSRRAATAGSCLG